MPLTLSLDEVQCLDLRGLARPCTASCQAFALRCWPFVAVHAESDSLAPAKSRSGLRTGPDHDQNRTPIALLTRLISSSPRETRGYDSLRLANPTAALHSGAPLLIQYYEGRLLYIANSLFSVYDVEGFYFSLGPFLSCFGESAIGPVDNAYYTRRDLPGAVTIYLLP